DAGVAGDGAHLQLAQALAAGVEVDVSGHGLGLDAAGDSAAQGDPAADAFHVDVAAVEVEPLVAADAFDAGLARRAHGDHGAADAVDLEFVAGHALHVDAGGHRVDVQAGLARDFQHQRGRLGIAAVARIAHAHRELAAAVVDLQALDTLAEAAG